MARTPVRSLASHATEAATVAAVTAWLSAALESRKPIVLSAPLTRWLVAHLQACAAKGGNHAA